MERLGSPLETGRGEAFRLKCDEPDCSLRWAVVAPLTVDDRVHGALVACAPRESAVLVRAAGEVARWVSVQLELADLDQSRTRLIEAEIKALRAQISPHFIFNSLAVIASFVRTDPERARELLLEFADFTRYSFRRHGDFTTLADELHAIDHYLALVRARFGDRLSVTLQIAPEVLPVALPFLCLQPLVENAVKHGLEGKADKSNKSHISITAQDAGAEALVVIEDNGIGMDPDRLRRILAGEVSPSGGIGLSNVDDRLRQVYGDQYGLVIETAVGAGMKITARLPKYQPGVHSAGPLPREDSDPPASGVARGHHGDREQTEHHPAEPQPAVAAERHRVGRHHDEAADGEHPHRLRRTGHRSHPSPGGVRDAGRGLRPFSPEGTRFARAGCATRLRA